jgi:hypothetical protein
MRGFTTGMPKEPSCQITENSNFRARIEVMPDLPFRVDLLKKMHLFHGVRDEYLVTIATAMQEQSYIEDNETVFKQGDKTNFLYVIYDGEVRISRQVKGSKEEILTSLFRGDYFGEQALLNDSRHDATVRASPGTVLLKLPRTDFQKMIKKMPRLRRNFQTMMKSRSMARKFKFPWLNKDEVIYYISRIHYFWLVQKLFAPMILLLLMILFSIAIFTATSALGENVLMAEAVILGLMLGAVLLVIGWRYIDWTNDYHIITNQRVIHMTRTIAIYDFRSEIRMDMIMSVTRDTNFLGRFFKFGTVVVRTLTGEIFMQLVKYPHQMVVMVEEYKARTKDIRQVEDERAIKDAIRKKLGYEPLVTTPPESVEQSAPASEENKAIKKPGVISILLGYIHELFDPRKEVDGTVTYHKHWIALWRTASIPTLSLLGLIAALFIIPILEQLGVFLLLWFIIFLGFLGWWGYEFWDWRNDLYQVTPEQILAIHRKPLGDEDRKAASLDNIMSINYERRGIIELLLSYGTVNIQVGNVDFSFIDVSEPANVQNDIQQRITQYRLKKQQAQAAAERERMAEWLAMYHKTMGEIDKQAGQTRDSESG